MRVLIVGIIVLAISVAGVSTYLIKSFSGEENIQKLEEQAKVKVFKVLVAAKDLQIGVPITAADLSWQPWPEDALNNEFIVTDDEEQEAEKMEEFVGGITRHVIKTGEPMLVSKMFKREGGGLMSGMLESGMGAVAVQVNALTSAAGFILPGDYVDVVMTHEKAKAIIKKMGKNKDKNNDNEGATVDIPKVLATVSETILHNVHVVATNQAVTGPEKGNAVVSSTITLEVTPKQAQILTTAATMGKLSLVLLSLEKGGEKPTELSYTTDVEVSPFLQNLDKILTEHENKQRAREALEQEQKAIQQEQKALQKEQEALQKEQEAKKAAKTATRVARKPVAKPKPVIKKKPIRI